MTAVTHPLFGRLLQANGFKRWGGELLLVVVLPDGSPGTVPAGSTDILQKPSAEPGSTTLSVEGLRHLQQMVATLDPRPERRARSARRK